MIKALQKAASAGLCALLFLLSGAFCACGAQPIEKSAHPVTVGIDLDPSSGLYTESGLYYMYDGESISFKELSAQGINIGEATGKKAGYSYETVNYSLLGAVVLGKEVLSDGIGDPMFTFLEWPLPSGDVLLCAADNAAAMVKDQTLPMLLASSSSKTYTPRASLSDCLTALYDGTPLVLPRVTDNNGTYLDGAVILKDGVLVQQLDAAQTALWAMLFYPSGSGSVTAGGISAQLQTVRRFSRENRCIIVEAEALFTSPGSPEDYSAALEQELYKLLAGFECDALLIDGIIGCPYSELKVQLTVRRY